MLQDRVALVTGASRGIGASIAAALAKAGCHVAVNYHRSSGAAEQVAEEVKSHGVKAMTVQADVSSPEACKAMVERVADHFGTIHILVNNAGINGHKPFLETDLEFAKRLYDVNCMSVVYMDHLVIPYMVRQRWGRVVTCHIGWRYDGICGKRRIFREQSGGPWPGQSHRTRAGSVQCDVQCGGAWVYADGYGGGG